MPDRQPIRPAPTTLADLLADLTWPRLFRAPRLAVRPARVGIALVYLLGLIVLSALANWIDGVPDANRLAEAGAIIFAYLQQATTSLVNGHPAVAAADLHTAFIAEPLACLRQSPFATILVFPLFLLWTAITGGAISRTAATELAWSRTTPWPSAVGLALDRWKHLTATLFVPLAAVWLISLAIAAAGLLLRWQWFNILAALLFGLALLAGLVAAFLTIALLASSLMLVPASVCEGADTFDALQHAAAMALGRPIRLVLYILLLVFQGLILGLFVALLLWTTLAIAQSASSTFSGPGGASITSVIGALSISEPPKTASRSEGIAGRIVGEWVKLVHQIGLAVMVSYGWCAATALFLAMRRVCDGQEPTELWQPGQVAGTIADASRPRAPTIIGTSPAQPSAPASDAILDNGPADET